MSITLYAQPYDISATGFYFTSADEYARQVATCRNDYGQPVEEFEIQFIDGESIDCALANAIGLSQCNYARFFEIAEDWHEHDKTRVIVAVGECGYSFDTKTEADDFDVEIYPAESFREFAQGCVEDGWFGEIPKALEFYIDYEAIARDLAVDYSQAEIAGNTLIYRCG